MTEVVFIPVNRAEFARQRAALAAEQRDRRYQPWLAIFNDALAKFRAAIASDASCPISVSPLHYDVLRIGQEKIGIHRELVFDPDEKRHHNQNRGYRLSVSIDLESGSKRHDRVVLTLSFFLLQDWDRLCFAVERQRGTHDFHPESEVVIKSQESFRPALETFFRELLSAAMV